MQLDSKKLRFSQDMKLTNNVRSSRTSLLSQDTRNEYPNIKITKILPYQNQARKSFDQEKLMELAESIKAYGLRQPLTIIASNKRDGFFEVVSGERRLKAAEIAGLEQVPCILLSDDSKALEIALIENIHREDLHPIELMYAYEALVETKVCSTQQDIADKLNQSKSTISEVMSLKNISIEVQTYIIKNNITSREILRTLTKLSEHDQKVFISNLEKSDVKVNNDNVKKKPRGLKQKSNVLQIVLREGVFEVERSTITKLSEIQKIQLNELLQKLL